MHCRASKSMACIAVAAVALAGCNTTGGLTSRFGTGSTPISNACAAERKPLIDTDQAFNETLLTGAVVGAVGGALLGVMVGDGRAVGALAGAAIGAAAGAGIGYLEAKKKEAKDTKEILALVDKDTLADQKTFGAAAKSISALQNCRVRQIEDLDRAVSTRQIDKEAARLRLKEIADAVEQDNALVNAVLQKSDERLDRYVRAVAVETKLDEAGTKTAVAEVAKERALQVRARQEQGIAYAKKVAELRTQASKTADTVASLDAGQPVVVLKKSGSWWRVSADGKTGFVQSGQLSSSKPKPAKNKTFEVQQVLSSSSMSALAVQIDTQRDTFAAAEEFRQRDQNISERMALLTAKLGPSETIPSAAVTP